MRRLGILFSVMVIFTGMILSCSKEEDHPVPVERKQYAWVAGFRDSTGYGMILFSSDGGETWVRQGQGTNALKDIDVFDIWAVDEMNVWAVCSDDIILKTTDGGQTWNRIQVPATSPPSRFSSISIVNRTNLWISGPGGVVMNSTNNGTSWRLFDTNYFHNGLMQGIWAITSQKVYVVGGAGPAPGHYRGFVAFTLDGGTTWDTVFPANDYNRNEWIGVTSSGNTIVVYGGKSHYMVSTDGGATWKNDSLHAGGGGGGGDINHLIMLSPQLWWGALDLQQIFLSTSGGSSWISQPAVPNGEFNVGIDAYGSQLALVVGTLPGWPEKGSIQRTTDGGTTWKNIHTYRSFLNKVTFIKL